jgi:predicted HicB family RNase H-like nuclease
MTNKREEYVFEPDLDLDAEEFIYQGERLTDERAAQIAEEALAEARLRNLIPGGKSLSGDGSHSPRVQFRVPQQLHDDAERAAREEGVSLSTLARRALEQYVRGKAS